MSLVKVAYAWEEGAGMMTMVNVECWIALSIRCQTLPD